METKKRVGITPHEYLSDFRISKSKKMLLKSENIADIAIQLGFFDQSHFSRIFRKTVGVSPGKYLKTNKIRYRDRGTPHSAPLPHHAAYGSELRGSADPRQDHIQGNNKP